MSVQKYKNMEENIVSFYPAVAGSALVDKINEIRAYPYACYYLIGKPFKKTQNMYFPGSLR